MIAKLKQEVIDWIGSWAWFIGSTMADAFDDRMKAIDDERSAELQEQDDEIMGLKVETVAVTDKKAN